MKTYNSFAALAAANAVPESRGTQHAPIRNSVVVATNNVVSDDEMRKLEDLMSEADEANSKVRFALQKIMEREEENDPKFVEKLEDIAHDYCDGMGAASHEFFMAVVEHNSGGKKTVDEW